MNIVILIVDALRPDHLSINGYKKETSPNMDKFCLEGTRFLNAYCTLPRSNPSITSLLTGMYTHTHGVRMIANNPLKTSISTLPEILGNHDYKTVFIGVGECELLIQKGFQEYNSISWKIKNKIKRGIYKTFHPNNFIGVAQQLIDVAINWIDKNSDKKFFLCMHINDIHWPYKIPEPYENMFDKDYKGKHDFNTLFDGKITRGELIFGKKKLSPEELEHAIAHYDGGVRYVDAHIERFFEFLKKRSIYDDTLIILTSDHGDNLGEQGLFFQHGSSLYEPSLKTTLVFRYPRIIPKGKIISSRIQNTDIMPTVLEMINVPLVDKIDGVSLMPLIQGKSEKIRDYIFAESIEEYFKENDKVFMSGVKGKWRAMIVDDWKIIYIPHPEKDIFELYNLKEDPKETKNLIDEEKEVAEKMKKRILDFLSTQDSEGEADLTTLTEKSKKLLIKAGYLQEEA